MDQDRQKTHRARAGFFGIIGYLLSPLSWWNDAYINIPIAYAISMPFLLIGKNAFLASIVAVYWFSNILGLVLLHSSAVSLAGKSPRSRRSQMVIDLLVSVAYTLIVVALIYFDILPTPRIEK